MDLDPKIQDTYRRKMLTAMARYNISQRMVADRAFGKNSHGRLSLILRGKATLTARSLQKIGKALRDLVLENSTDPRTPVDGGISRLFLFLSEPQENDPSRVAVNLYGVYPENAITPLERLARALCVTAPQAERDHVLAALEKILCELP